MYKRQVFGALMLAVAVWMLSRFLPERVSFLLWIVPLASLAFVLLRASLRSGAGLAIGRGIGVAAAVWALLIGVGAMRGATDPLAPWQRAETAFELPFVTIKSVADLDREVAAATSRSRSATDLIVTNGSSKAVSARCHGASGSVAPRIAPTPISRAHTAAATPMPRPIASPAPLRSDARSSTNASDASGTIHSRKLTRSGRKRDSIHTATASISAPNTCLLYTSPSPRD